MSNKFKIAKPNQLQFVSFPIFALSWYATPTPPSDPNAFTVLSYCGGGGSAKTGISNSVQVIITTPSTTTAATTTIDANDANEDKSGNTRIVEIDTGEEIGLSVALHQPLNQNIIWVLLGIGSEVWLYEVPIHLTTPSTDDDDDAPQKEFTLLTKVSLKEKGVVNEVDGTQQQQEQQQRYDANSVAFNPMGNGIVVGCENGKVCIYNIVTKTSPSTVTFQKYVELSGHEKAICTTKFHPKNPNIVLSSAKDGTCRVWDIPNKHCIDTMICKIYPSDGPAPKKLPKVGQVLVRGCAFGDLNGQIIYTIQSGRKGAAYLSVWRVVQRVIDESPNQQQTTPGAPPSSPQRKTVIQFQEQARKSISPHPVSAMSLSGDFSTLVIGNTDGTVKLLSTDTFKELKRWDTLHDLPVTCIAARPLPMEFPGEDLTGVMVDAISASADNKMAFLTKQRKSTLIPPKKARPGGKRVSHGLFYYLVNLCIFVIIAYVAALSYQVCVVELTDVSGLELGAECIWNTILWAPSDRPGISSVPF